VEVALVLVLLSLGLWGLLLFVHVGWLISLRLLPWECPGHPFGIWPWVTLAGLGWLLHKAALDLSCGWWHLDSWLPQGLEIGVQLDVELW